MRASDFEIHNYRKLDKILSKLCGMIVKGKQDRPDYYGMVAAAVVDPDNQIVARLNRPGENGKRIHAEHAAMTDYADKYGDIPQGSIIITTLSPCNEQMAERDGVSCTELINRSTVKKVYCGYMDPTQDDDTRQFNLMETADKQLRNKCKQFADTFLDKIMESNVFTDARMNAIKAGKKVFKVHGKTYNVTGDITDELEAGVDETFISETAMMGKIEDSGKIIRILKKAHTVPFSDEKNWLLVDMDPAKGNKGLGIKWIPADTRFEWVRPYRDSVDENFNDDAEEYRAHLIKTLPKMMKLFANIGKGWIPSKEQMLSAVDTAYQVMKHTGDAKQAGKVLMDELNALYRMSQGKQGVAEGSLGTVLPWPEVVNKVNSAMKAMGWKGQRKADGSFMFSTKGQLDDEFYIVIIDNEGNSMFTYALGTVEEGDPHIGEQDTLPTTEASVSELMNAIQDGFGLNENFTDGRNPQDKGDVKRHGINTKASVSSLRKTAKQGGRKGQLAHWLANMKSGKAKNK